MSRLDPLRDALAALSDAAGSPSAIAPRSSSTGGLPFYSGGRSRPRARATGAERAAIERYRRIYHDFPIATAAVDQFVDDVTADGYSITADDPATVDYLDGWTSGCVVAGGQRGRDLRELLGAIPREIMVCGSALIEIAPTRGDASAVGGFAAIRPESVTPYTDPRNGLLVAPSDADRLADVKITDEGHAAAFAQNPGSRDERLFSQDDLIKLDRSPEPGDVFGRSSIAPAADRIEQLLEKLAMTDDAVARRAWGSWIYRCGPTETPDGLGGSTVEHWTKEELSNFADKARALDPGESLAVSGDVDLEHVAGEVPEIIDLLGWEVDFILSALPAPKYAVGWGSDLNQFTTEHQERAHRDRVASMRQRIESALTPALKAAARQQGFADDGVTLSLSADPSESPGESTSRTASPTVPEVPSRSRPRATRRESFGADLDPALTDALATLSDVKYSGTRNGKLDESEIDPDDFASHYLIAGETKSDSSYPVVDSEGYLRRGNVGAAWDLRGHAEVAKSDLETKLRTLAKQFDEPPIPADALADGSDSDSDEPTEPTEPAGESAGFDFDAHGPEIEPEVETIATALADLLIEARDSLLSAIADEYDAARESIDSDSATDTDALARARPGLVARLGSILKRVLSGFVDESIEPEISETIRPALESALSKTATDLASESGPEPSIEGSFGVPDEPAAEAVGESIRTSIESATEDMRAAVAGHVKRGLEDGLAYDDVADEIRADPSISDAKLERHAGTIARNEVQRSVARARMDEFEASNVVVGVSFINPCDRETTPLCRRLAGCSGGDPVRVYFDDGPIDEQLAEIVPESEQFDGFSLSVPGFHHGCRTGLAALTSRD